MTFPIVVSALPHAATNRASRYTVETWEGFVSMLTGFNARGTKDGPAWSPLVWEGDQRAAERFEAAIALVYDLDWDDSPLAPERMAALSAALERTGFRFILHETYTKNRFRLCVPSSRPMDAGEYREAFVDVATELGIFGLIDKSGSDLARLFYLPSHPPGETRDFEVGGSKYFEPRVLPEKMPKAPPQPAPIDLGLIAEKLDGEAKALLEGKRRVPVGERHDTIVRISNDVITACDGDLDLALALMEAIAARSFDGAMDPGWVDSLRKDAKRALAPHVPAVEALGAIEGLAAVKAEDAKASKAAWESLLKYDPKGNLLPTSANVDVVLRYHHEFGLHIRFNELYRRPEITGGALYEAGADGRNRFEGSYDVALLQWMERTMSVSPGQKTCGAAMILAAKRNGYNPVRDYLMSVKWDGTPRIDSALHWFCSCSGNDPYVASVSRKFFIAAVARALTPGCKVDTVLILRGPQGTGKTSFVEALAGPWYATCSNRIDNKDTEIQATEAWFVELSELASMSRSSTEQMRGFLTRREDRIRIPYATYHESFPRRCVFVGTTNEERPLTDPEGNRRFWVVEAGRIRVDEVIQFRDQLFAEAVMALNTYLADKAAGTPDADNQNRWWFTPSEQAISDSENQLFMHEDILAEGLRDWAAGAHDEDWFSLTDIAKQVLGLAPERVMMEQGLVKRIRTALRRCNWKPANRVLKNGATLSGYKPPSRVNN